MPSKSLKQQRFFKAVLHAKKNPDYGDEHLKKVASSMPEDDIKKFANHLAEFKEKKAMLSILKDIKEQVGISEPMYLQEDDDGKTQSIDPIASESPVYIPWEKYLPQFLGQPFKPKELDVFANFEKEPISPTKQQLKGNPSVQEVWYKGTDEIGMNKTTVIKKLKDGGQFSYNAFVKSEKPVPVGQKDLGAGGGGNDLGLPPLEEQGPQMGGTMPTPPATPPPGSANPPTTPDDPTDDQEKKKEDNKEKEKVTLTKSILFEDEIKGAAILVEFLKKIKP